MDITLAPNFKVYIPTIKEAKKDSKQKKNLCFCETYEIGLEGLWVITWDDTAGKRIWSKETGLTTSPTVSCSKEEIEMGRDTWVNEVHSAQSMIGCEFKYNQLPLEKAQWIVGEILTRWELR